VLKPLQIQAKISDTRKGSIMRQLKRRNWFTVLVLGQRDFGIGDVVLAVVLSLYAVDLVTGHNSKHLDGGWSAAVAVLLMTAPVIFARRQPLAAAATLAFGAALNWALIGHLIRCGATLPAVFYVAFVIGSRCQRRDVVIGIALLAVNLVCQGWSDPKLGSPSVAIVMVPISLAFMGAGRLLRSRNAKISELEARTAELRAQRELNAKMAVEADRARIAGDLDEFLHDQVTKIVSAASAGRATLEAQPDEAQDAFVSIQETGRETLTHMRDVVRSLQDNAPTEPQPVLTQLDRLISQSASSEIQLHVNGDPRMLPPGLELSGYRIVEHLLLTLADNTSSRASVGVTFQPDALELRVVGTSVRESDARPALAAATERAVLHGGTLRSNLSKGLRETVVQIPIPLGQV
jgi:signal transduction histidine kinase